jgi:carboxylate-amine ligase
MIPFAQALDEILDLIAEDAEMLECVAEVTAARQILKDGTSADQQRKVYEKAIADGGSQADALSAVVAFLVSEFNTDL